MKGISCFVVVTPKNTFNLKLIGETEYDAKLNFLVKKLKYLYAPTEELMAPFLENGYSIQEIILCRGNKKETFLEETTKNMVNEIIEFVGSYTEDNYREGINKIIKNNLRE